MVLPLLTPQIRDFFRENGGLFPVFFLKIAFLRKKNNPLLGK